MPLAQSATPWNVPHDDSTTPPQKIVLGGKTMDEVRAEVARDDPAAATFLLITELNALWRLADTQGIERSHVEQRAFEIHARLRALRAVHGAKQREHDLQTLRFARERAGLVVVIGAGVSMGAGLPGWPELVRAVLARAFERTANDDVRRGDVRTTLELLDAGGEEHALLLRGAELAQDVLGPLFVDEVATALYAESPKPSFTHEAIAELAFPIQPKLGALHGPRGMRAGWDAIVTYNFDVLMDEALDALGIARESYAMQHGVPWPFRPSGIERVPPQMRTKVLHMHGRVPRPPEPCDAPRLVLSAQQYRDAYDGERDLILDSLVRRNLTVPGHYALYVGCSFQDDAMNSLLRDAWRERPGRSHYALLRWEGARVVAESKAEEIDTASERFVAMGVQPIWFDRFDELPGLIRSLG